MTNLTQEELQTKLNGFIGTENLHKVNPFSRLLITDGIKCFADTCQCYWAIDEVAFVNNKLMMKDNFYVITFDVSENHELTISAKTDTDQPTVWSKTINDLLEIIPVGTYEFYLTDSVLLLKSEY